MERLQEAGIQISMDGRGCWMDNFFIERLWRSLKYEEVYLNAYESVRSARPFPSRSEPERSRLKRSSRQSGIR